MNKELLNEILALYVNKVRENYGSAVDRIILFGSYARDDYNEYSDIDLMVLLEMEDIPAVRRNMREYLNELEWNYDVLIAPVYQNNKVFEKYKVASGFYRKIEEEGHLVG